MAEDQWLPCHWPLFVSPAKRYGYTGNFPLPIPVTNLKFRCGRAGVADPEAYVGRIRAGDAYSVHVNYKIKLAAAAVLSLDIEVDFQTVDRSVKGKVHVSAHLLERTSGNGQRETIHGEGEGLMGQINSGAGGAQR